MKELLKVDYEIVKGMVEKEMEPYIPIIHGAKIYKFDGDAPDDMSAFNSALKAFALPGPVAIENEDGVVIFADLQEQRRAIGTAVQRWFMKCQVLDDGYLVGVGFWEHKRFQKAGHEFYCAPGAMYRVSPNGKMTGQADLAGMTKDMIHLFAHDVSHAFRQYVILTKGESPAGVEYDNVANLENLESTEKPGMRHIDIGGRLRIQNSGTEIAATNYWKTDYAKHGFFYLSTNAGCIRLLVPSIVSGEALQETYGRPSEVEDIIKEMATAHSVILSRGMYEGQDSVEILFEDDSDTPYTQIISLKQCDRIWPKSQSGTNVKNGVAVYTEHGGKVLQFADCKVRNVDTLPCMKFWDGRRRCVLKGETKEN